MNASKFDELVAKLREIFQIDDANLDFGVYRILAMKAKQIDDFLKNRLAEKVREKLSENANAEKSELEAKLEKAISDAKNLGVNPDELPKVRELRQKIAALGNESADAETQVYSHLLTFFSRYYDNGDFISKRRYKGDVYAIPYAGEEVKLHWANADQYYTKSGENFTEYAFKIDDLHESSQKVVRFKLVSAEIAKDNNKDADGDRRFVLWDPANAKTNATDDFASDSDESDEDAPAVPADFIEETASELCIYFQFKKYPKGTTQKDLNKASVEKIKQKLPAKWAGVLAPAPTEKNKNRVLLERELTRYTEKNSRDYFIHKNLKKFLTRELDFYIKNEMLHLDDISAAGAFADIEANLRKIQAMRTVAEELIAFMAQLENFQKKLWLKKKFVVSAEYCFTLDRVPAKMLPEIFGNEKQQTEWERLGFDWRVAKDFWLAGTRSNEELALNTASENGEKTAVPVEHALMVDTKFFPKKFKEKLLASFDNLDESCDGVLVHSENFQALRLLRTRYQNKVKCIYIDPPYNTGNDGFIYKDGYSHSSWLTMMRERLSVARAAMPDDGVIFISIDDNEQAALKTLCDEVFGKENFAGNISWQRTYSPRNDSTGISNEIEHILACSRTNLWHPLKLARTDKMDSKFKNPDGDLNPWTSADAFAPGGKDHQGMVYAIQHPFTGKMIYPYNNAHWAIDQKKMFEEISAWGKYEYKNLHDEKERADVCGISESEVRTNILGIVLSEPLSIAQKHAKEIYKKGNWPRYYFTSKGQGGIRRKKYLNNMEGKIVTNMWSYDDCGHTDRASKELKELFNKKPFQTPKPTKLINRILQISTKGGTSETILDYFAGSGTTGHAVINLNREDGGKRKYILVEMGAHFETVLKPRIEKVVYSPDWKNGVPEVTGKGISHAFKYLTLESYEDTLNNLELDTSASDAVPAPLRDEYLLRYSLDIEARANLLSTADFQKPFDYKLKIAADTASSAVERKIDLVETFNYLIGLCVETLSREEEKGVACVTGTLPSGERSLIIWRDCEKIDNAALNKIFEKNKFNVRDSEFDVVFVNGDHALENLALDADGNETDVRRMRVRQIEDAFLDAMFADDE